jgi:hypothetical protein
MLRRKNRKNRYENVILKANKHALERVAAKNILIDAKKHLKMCWYYPFI